MFFSFHDGPNDLRDHGSKREERESMLLVQKNVPGRTSRAWQTKACLFLDQIKREKGVWWMPWQQEAMKDVILCDKLWRAENRL